MTSVSSGDSPGPCTAYTGVVTRTEAASSWCQWYRGLHSKQDGLRDLYPMRVTAICSSKGGEAPMVRHVSINIADAAQRGWVQQVGDEWRLKYVG